MKSRRVSVLVFTVGISGVLGATGACGALTGIEIGGEGPGGGRRADGTTCGASGDCCEGGGCADAGDAGDAEDAPLEHPDVTATDSPVGPLGDAGPRSCRPGGPGMSNCGDGHESCCTSLEVAGGTFFRTYENSGTEITLTADRATVSTFKLDKYLVTVGRFRQYVNAWSAGEANAPAGSGKHTYLNGGNGLANSGAPGTYETGWVASDDANISPTDSNLTISSPYSTWTRSALDRENLPIDCANWYEAFSFCIWDGGFLPSEAEWGYAAAGGKLQREYPWGQVDPSFQNQYAIFDCYYPSQTPSCVGVKNIAPVGSTTQGAGLWGQLDMAGEFFEWTADWYDVFVNPCTDCARLTDPNPPGRGIRGGTFGYGATTELLSASRNNDPPTSRGYDGFRCARAP